MRPPSHDFAGYRKVLAKVTWPGGGLSINSRAIAVQGRYA
jgi:hypothetical protein